MCGQGDHPPYSMLPGQEPYSPGETTQLHALVADGAEGDPGETAEPRYYGTRYSGCPAWCMGHPEPRTTHQPIGDPITLADVRCVYCGNLFYGMSDDIACDECWKARGGKG